MSRDGPATLRFLTNRRTGAGNRHISAQAWAIIRDGSVPSVQNMCVPAKGVPCGTRLEEKSM